MIEVPCIDMYGGIDSSYVCTGTSVLIMSVCVCDAVVYNTDIFLESAGVMMALVKKRSCLL